MGFMIFTVVLALAALGIGVYIASRFRKFTPLRRLAERSRGLSWLAAAAPVAAIGCFWFINVTTMAVVLLHLALIWAICDGVGAIIDRIAKKRPAHYIAGVAAVSITVVYLGIGWFLGHHVFMTEYEFETHKELGRENIRIVEMSDSHLGITQDGESFAEICGRVQELRPDAVVIVGDFVDDDTDRADMIRAAQALGELETTYGVYFVYGNHDNGYFNYRNFTSGELRAELEKNGVTVLEDESVLVGGSVYIVGRRDRSAPDRLPAEELTRGLDKSKYIVMLDHQPNDYDAEAAAQADLVLSGHTHGGHIFPAGLIGLAMGANDMVYGTENRHGTDFVVTSGVSGWAIPFKTGTISEFAVIDIRGK